MLSAKRLPEVLRTSMGDGIIAACLMTVEGSVLCSVSLSEADGCINETTFAALSSSIMNNYLQGNPDVSFLMMKFENGLLAVTAVGKSYVVAAYGRNVALGLLRGRLLTLGQHFAQVFDQLK